MRRKLNFQRLVTFALGAFILILSFQNCDSQFKSVRQSPAPVLKGGEGYSGAVKIDVAAQVQPGETVNATIQGGTPPYILTSSSPDAIVSETDAPNVFSISVSPTASAGGTFTLTAEDVNHQLDQKVVSITMTPITALPGHENVSTAVYNLPALFDGLAVMFTNNQSSTLYDSEVITYRYNGPGNVDTSIPAISAPWNTPAIVLSLYNDLLLTGTYSEQIGNTFFVGSAKLYKLINGAWVNLATFLPTVQESFLQFGSSVSLTENAFAVGTFSAHRSGLVHVYSNTGPDKWELETVIDDPKQQSAFGATVKMGSNILFAYGSDGSGHGRVEIFDKISGQWSHTAHLESLDPGQNSFGTSLGYDGRFLAVGNAYRGWNFTAPNDAQPGVVDIYTKQNGDWSRIQQLVSGDGTAGSPYGRFGLMLGLDGGLLAVLEPGLSTLYVYRFNSESQQFQLLQKFGKQTFGDGELMGLAVHNGKVLVSVRLLVKSGLTNTFNSRSYMLDFENLN
jgi:hypothetical protein